MKRVMVALAIILALLGGTYGAVLLTRTQKPVEAQQTILETKTPELDANVIHELVNAERAKAGLPALVRDSRLDTGAQRKADELTVEGWDTTPHYDSQGRPGLDYSVELAPECKKPKSYENLGFGIEESSTVVGLWMNSTSHREAMLSPSITIVGYGISGGYVAQHMC